MKDKGNKQMISGRERWSLRVLPVNEVKVFLQVSRVNVALAELQLGSGVVVNVVNTHFLHDAKTSLRRQRGLDGDGGGCRYKEQT